MKSAEKLKAINILWATFGNPDSVATEHVLFLLVHVYKLTEALELINNRCRSVSVQSAYTDCSFASNISRISLEET